MKYRWMMALWAGLFIVAPMAQVSAHEMENPGMADGHDGFKGREKLGLSDDQSAKLKTLRRAERDAITPLRDKQEDLVKKLHEQVKNKASDGDLQATLKDLKANRKAMHEQMEKFEAQRETVLTPTQQAKMALMVMKHRHMKFGGYAERGEEHGDRRGHDEHRGPDHEPGDSPAQTDAQ